MVLKYQKINDIKSSKAIEISLIIERLDFLPILNFDLISLSFYVNCSSVD